MLWTLENGILERGKRGLEAVNKGWICLLRPKEQDGDRKECPSEKRQDERDARGRRKVEQTPVPGQAGRDLFTEHGGHGVALTYSLALGWL